MQNKIAQIAAKIKAGGNNVVFTGAGISTESGIPDYRSQGGIWDKFRPVYFDEFMSSKDARAEYWRRWVELYQGIVAAQPNPAHLALARLHDLGLLQAVVTQNVDGLHLRAGNSLERTYQIHGNLDFVRCARECHRSLQPFQPVRLAMGRGHDPDPPGVLQERELLSVRRHARRSPIAKDSGLGDSDLGVWSGCQGRRLPVPALDRRR